MGATTSVINNPHVRLRGTTVSKRRPLDRPLLTSTPHSALMCLFAAYNSGDVAVVRKYVESPDLVYAGGHRAVVALGFVRAGASLPAVLKDNGSPQNGTLEQPADVRDLACGPPLSTVSASADLLVTASIDGLVRVFDVASKVRLLQFSPFDEVPKQRHDCAVQNQPGGSYGQPLPPPAMLVGMASWCDPSVLPSARSTDDDPALEYRGCFAAVAVDGRVRGFRVLRRHASVDVELAPRFGYGRRATTNGDDESGDGGDRNPGDDVRSKGSWVGAVDSLDLRYRVLRIPAASGTVAASHVGRLKRRIAERRHSGATDADAAGVMSNEPSFEAASASGARLANDPFATTCGDSAAASRIAPFGTAPVRDTASISDVTLSSWSCSREGSPDHQHHQQQSVVVAVAAWDGVDVLVQCTDSAAVTDLHFVSLPECRNGVASVAVAPSNTHGAVIYAVGLDHLVVIDALAGVKLRSVRGGHSGLLTSVAVAADGSRVATGCSDGTFLLRDSSDMENVLDVVPGAFDSGISTIHFVAEDRGAILHGSGTAAFSVVLVPTPPRHALVQVVPPAVVPADVLGEYVACFLAAIIPT